MENKPVLAKTIIVTRPKTQGAYLCVQLREMGFQVDHVPVIEIHPLQDASHQKNTQDCFSSIREYDGVIFVSLNAAEQALPWLEKFPLAKKNLLYAVGKTTASYVQQQLVAATHPVCFPSEQMDSEGLLGLPALQAPAVQGKRFLILRGRGGRELIATTLQERGAQVDSCELYERSMPANQHSLQQCVPRCDLLMVTSVESLENLLALTGTTLKDQLQEKTVLVPGERVAAAARKAGFRHIITAPNATDAAVIDTISRWVAVS